MYRVWFGWRRPCAILRHCLLLAAACCCCWCCDSSDCSQSHRRVAADAVQSRADYAIHSTTLAGWLAEAPSCMQSGTAEPAASDRLPLLVSQFDFTMQHWTCCCCRPSPPHASSRFGKSEASQIEHTGASFFALSLPRSSPPLDARFLGPPAGEGKEGWSEKRGKADGSPRFGRKSLSRPERLHAEFWQRAGAAGSGPARRLQHNRA